MNDELPLPTLVLRPATDELDELLAGLQLLVLRHPVAASAAFATLVAEGRRYAATPEGQTLRARLGATPVARRLREALEIGTMNALDADPTGPLPSDLVELIFAAAMEAQPMMGGRKLWVGP